MHLITAPFNLPGKKKHRVVLHLTGLNLTGILSVGTAYTPWKLRASKIPKGRRGQKLQLLIIIRQSSFVRKQVIFPATLKTNICSSLATEPLYHGNFVFHSSQKSKGEREEQKNSRRKECMCCSYHLKFPFTNKKIGQILFLRHLFELLIIFHFSI